MAKMKNNLRDHLKSCDTVIEVIDARAPFASRNSDFEKYIKFKSKILVINKSDLIDRNIASSLEKHFKKKYNYVVAISATNGSNIRNLLQALNNIFKKKELKMMKRKLVALPIKTIILGIPNVGKSQIINTLTGRKIAKVANTPGFTRGQQWINVLPNVELLDTPGVVWFNNSGNEVNKLIIIGAMKTDEFEEAAEHLLDILSKKVIETYYGISPSGDDSREILYNLSKSMKIENIHKKFIEDYRKGLFGQISLESA